MVRPIRYSSNNWSGVCNRISNALRCDSVCSARKARRCSLVISVPRYFPERICWGLSREYHQANQGHVRIYRKKALIGMIEHTGLTLYRFHYAHSLHTPYWWLKCLVGPTRSDSTAVNLCHRFLTWDILHHPRLTRQLDRLLNPILGKSLVLYFRKPR